MKSQKMTIHLPAELIEELEVISKTNERSRHRQIIFFIREGIEKEEKKKKGGKDVE